VEIQDIVDRELDKESGFMKLFNIYLGDFGRGFLGVSGVGLFWAIHCRKSSVVINCPGFRV